MTDDQQPLSIPNRPIEPELDGFHTYSMTGLAALATGFLSIVLIVWLLCKGVC